MKVLVVDDNPANLKLACDILACEGFEVMRAANAEEVLATIGDSQPEVILMDIGIPGMDGLTLTRKLKSNEPTKHIRIVALTAFAMKGDDQKAREAGCDGYLTKPINTRTLSMQIMQILQGDPVSENAQ